MQEQFQRMRTAWRSVASVFRMQACFVHNDILDLCGIRSLLLRSFETSTIPETSDQVEAVLSGYEYNNVMEMIGPWRVHSIPAQSQAILSQIITSNQFQTLSPEEQQALPRISAFRNAALSNSQSAFVENILDGLGQGQDLLSNLQPQDTAWLSAEELRLAPPGVSCGPKSISPRASAAPPQSPAPQTLAHHYRFR